MTSKVNGTAAQTQNRNTENEQRSVDQNQQSDPSKQDESKQDESKQIQSQTDGQNKSGNPFSSNSDGDVNPNTPSVEVVPVVIHGDSESIVEATTAPVAAPTDTKEQKDEQEIAQSPVAETSSAETSSAETPVAETSCVEKVAVRTSGEETVVAKSTEPVQPPAEKDSPAADPFKALGLRDDVYKAIKGFGYQTPTAIQKETVSVILEGRDVIGQAETGSGKTAAFAWPLLSQIDLKNKSPQILVLAPTRELALQVTAAFEKYGSSMKGLKCVTVYGGQSYETQFRALERGVHVVVGTPGRIMDHINRKTLKLDQVKTFVLDEADEMLRMGFIDDVQWVMERLPKVRQTLSFSATMPAPIRTIAKKYLDDPVHITIKSKTGTADSIDQSFVVVNFREKLETLCRLLETEETDGVIVFVKTRQTTNVVAEQLVKRGFDTAALNGDIAQNQRERTVNRLKAGKIDIVLATDVAARGLDVKRISHVINYDFPHDTETYVHRIGRTGRAGRAGKAVLFVEPKEKRKLGWLEKDTKQKIAPFKTRSIGEINELRVEKFKRQVIDAANDSQMDFFRELVKSLVEENPHSIETFAAALAVMAQGTTPLLLTDAPAGRKATRKHLSDADKASYRVEVGRSHGAGPGNIVGAIANEAGLQNGEIGKIKMFDRFSFIDLPSGLADDLLDVLRNVQVSGQRLQISRSTGTHGRSDHSNRRRSNNGSTDFGKRQKPFRGRKSISRNDGDSNSPPKNRSNSGAKTASGYRKPNQVATKARLGKSTEASDSNRDAARKPKVSKPAKKYIKVRAKK